MLVLALACSDPAVEAPPAPKSNLYLAYGGRGEGEIEPCG